MENVLSLSVAQQNNFKESVLDSIIRDNMQYAQDGNIADYLLDDFAAYPEGWDSLFEYSYDSVSTKAKENRKSILINLLVMRGLIPTQE